MSYSRQLPFSIFGSQRRELGFSERRFRKKKTSVVLLGFDGMAISFEPDEEFDTGSEMAIQYWKKDV